MANKNSVNSLSEFLNEEVLADPASRALANMDEDVVDEALVAALSAAKTDKIKLILINAIGQSENEITEPTLLDQLKKTQDKELNAELYNALSKVGTIHSIPVLKQAAESVNYQIDLTKATSSYVDLLNKLVDSNPLAV